MEHLSIETLVEYIDTDEYNPQNADRMEEISEHLMECKACADKYQKALLAAQIAEEFPMYELAGIFEAEEKRKEEYQICSLVNRIEEDKLKQRILNWAQKKRVGIENSVKLYLCDVNHDKISGMIKNKVQNLSLLSCMTPLSPALVRGSNGIHQEISTIFVAKDSSDNRIILDGNVMSLVIRLEKRPEYLKNAPIVILLPKDSKMEPLVQAADEKNGFFCIEFYQLGAGEYDFYVEEG